MSQTHPAARRASLRVVHRNPLMGVPSSAFLAQVREHAQNGERVRVSRYARAFYYLVQNGSLFLILSAEDRALGTFDNIAAAVMAGDRHVDDLVCSSSRGAS